MLCPRCHRQVQRSSAFCDSCGAQIGAVADGGLEIVLADGTRVPVAGTLTIGRAPESSIQLADPTVSSHHARLVVDARRGALVQDDGSRYGTYLDDQKVEAPAPLHDGARLRLGDVVLLVERRRQVHEAGRTLVIPVGGTQQVPALAPGAIGGTPGGFRPRLRSGYALKRLPASEGGRRWVLKDLRGGGFVRFGDGEAELLQLLDGTRTLPDLIGEAEGRLGPAGPAQLARTLADLGDKGLLSGVEGASDDGEEGGFLRRALRPRERASERAGERFDRLYQRGGWLLFTRPALVLEALVALAGVAAFAYLTIGRYGTPLVVAKKVGVGGLVFLAGRLVVAMLHETAHGLAVASFGRRVRRAGIKLLLIFPYGFVDTTDAYFEPRRRRIAISAAGPVSDLVLGGAFSLLSLVAGRGTLRDIVFQLAFGAYVGALLNLNPFLDRDGYHIMVDALGLPGLRRRSRERLKRMLAGRPSAPGDTRALSWYAGISLVWLAVSLGLAVGMSLLYYDRLVALTHSRQGVWAGLGVLYLVLFLPVALVAGRPLLQRHRAPRVRVDDVPV